MNKERYFYKDGRVFSFSPLQISDGLSEGLQELTPDELESWFNKNSGITINSLKEDITKKRWEIETGGISLPNGLNVATGIDDQNRITTVVANAERSGIDEFDFKAISGWTRVTLAELQEISSSIARHVQACFSAERAHHEAIDSIALTDDPVLRQAELDSYDTSKGWPK